MITLEYPKNRAPDGTFRLDGYFETLKIDAAPTETYNFFAQSVESPIQAGAVLSDHTIKNPEFVSFECVITNTPTLIRDTFPFEYNQGFMPSVREVKPPDNRVTRAYEVLRALRDFSPPVTVVTGWGPEFPNMVVEIFTIRRNVLNANSLHFQLGLKRVDVAFAQTVDTGNLPRDPVEDRGKAGTGRGNQPPVPKEETASEAALKARKDDIGPLKRVYDYVTQ